MSVSSFMYNLLSSCSSKLLPKIYLCTRKSHIKFWKSFRSVLVEVGGLHSRSACVV